MTSKSHNLTLIAAVGTNDVIGHENKLPWHIPEDLKHFKKETMGHCVIMGRKTWESIGKPLTGRKNIVVTRNKNYQASGAHVVNSLEEAFALCEDDSRPFVIGGAELYTQALPHARYLSITEVDKEITGDAFFPKFKEAEYGGEWTQTSREKHEGFDFVTYERCRFGS